MSKKNKNTGSNAVSTNAEAAKTATTKVACHSGNVSVMYYPVLESNLYCGGWSRGANSEGLVVIDLTGSEPIDGVGPIRALNESAKKEFAKVIELNQAERSLPWLSFKVKDFGVPDVERETWAELADAILNLMKQGHSVLLACNGGHGRTGTAAAIICHMLNNSVGDPVEYIRSVYCNSAVETYEQHKYVNKMCGLDVPKDIGYKHEYKTTYYNYGGYGGYAGGYQQGYQWNQTKLTWEPPSPQPETEPPTSGGTYLTDKRAGEISKYLNGLLISNEIVVYSKGSAVEVVVIQGGDMIYYEVVDISETDSSVKVENVKTGETRTLGLEFLAKSVEVEAYYESLE